MIRTSIIGSFKGWILLRPSMRCGPNALSTRWSPINTSRDTPLTKNWPMRSGSNCTITWATTSTYSCSAMTLLWRSSLPSCSPLSLPGLMAELKPCSVRLRKPLNSWRTENIPIFQGVVPRSQWFSNLLSWAKTIEYCRSLQPPSFSSYGRWKSPSRRLTTIQRITMWESSWTTSHLRCQWRNVTKTIDARGTQSAPSWREESIHQRSWIRFASLTWTTQMGKMVSSGLSLSWLHYLWSRSLFTWVAVSFARWIQILTAK